MLVVLFYQLQVLLSTEHLPQVPQPRERGQSRAGDVTDGRKVTALDGNQKKGREQEQGDLRAN